MLDRKSYQLILFLRDLQDALLSKVIFKSAIKEGIAWDGKWGATVSELESLGAGHTAGYNSKGQRN